MQTAKTLMAVTNAFAERAFSETDCFAFQAEVDRKHSFRIFWINISCFCFKKRIQEISFVLRNEPLVSFRPLFPGSCPASSCGKNQKCVTPRGIACECLEGFERIESNGKTLCSDIDECAAGTHNCAQNFVCFNTVRDSA